MFLDVDDLEEIGNLGLYVKQTWTMLFFLSKVRIRIRVRVRARARARARGVTLNPNQSPNPNPNPIPIPNFVLSKGYFASRNCRKEIQFTLKNKNPIILLHG